MLQLPNLLTARRRVRGFRLDEAGSVIVLSLFLFVMMLVFVGTAVDMVRHETTRVKLQNTVDRAVLAAADLDQELDPQSVVEDYFAKARMSSYLTGVDVQEGLNYRSVSARTVADVDTFFTLGPRAEPLPNESVTLADWYDNMGKRRWAASAAGTAEDGFTDIEISLIVDVSGSMNSYSRIDNLKDAAKEFVDAVMINDANSPSVTSISLVPYSAVVNIGPSMAPHYRLSSVHDYSHCPRFETPDFDDLSIDPDTELDIIAHFEYGSGRRTPINNPWCPTENDRGNAIVPFATDPATLKNAIDDLDAYGNTAIDMGMKWGAALLDPGTRSVTNGLITDGAVSGDASGRPYDYGESRAMKVVVLMTDGANTTEFDLREPYKSGMSDIWVKRDYADQPLGDVDRDQFSILFNDRNSPNDHTDDRFMRLDTRGRGRVLRHPYGYEEYDDSAGTPDSSGLVSRLSWAEIFATWEFARVNNELLGEAYSRGYISRSKYRGPDNAVVAIMGSNGADDRLSTICSAARDEGTIIYTIAFEAPNRGVTALRDCATSSGHFFDVEGTDISEAFAAIASDITRLRLTQ